MNVHAFNTTAIVNVVSRRCGTMLGYDYFKCLCNKMCS